MLSLNSSPSSIEAIEREAWLDLFAAAPESVKAKFALRRDLLNGTPVLGSNIPIFEFNRAFVLDDRRIAVASEAVDWLKKNAAPNFALQLVADGTTRELQSWALQRGFIPQLYGWSKLIKNLVFSGDGPELKSEALELITDPDPAVYGQLVVHSFGLPEETKDWFGALVGRPNWTVYVALLNGEPVGSSALFVKDRWAWLGIDGTLEKARRRGVQAAMIQARVKMARTLGAISLTAETGRPEKLSDKHTSRDNFLRNGFLEGYQRLNLSQL